MSEAIVAGASIGAIPGALISPMTNKWGRKPA
eukprot:CAMPEP_0175166378 /NCGR_PEP_ID=MMETSP0087-20121206/27674_1 /TAXON_ID=136419 /ORGANISM="Unknown Unknown, Strain D1" /LENGTH=31 /DNA_ID= /DNA_START= /DNA_END= /DNA_ORIENTATION=